VGQSVRSLPISLFEQQVDFGLESSSFGLEYFELRPAGTFLSRGSNFFKRLNLLDRLFAKRNPCGTIRREIKFGIQQRGGEAQGWLLVDPRITVQRHDHFDRLPQSITPFLPQSGQVLRIRPANGRGLLGPT
jgi:hypothetical protein